MKEKIAIKSQRISQVGKKCVTCIRSVTLDAVFLNLLITSQMI